MDNSVNSLDFKVSQLIAINIISSKDDEEEREMHSSSGNTEFASYNDANKVVNVLFESFRSRYPLSLQTE